MEDSLTIGALTNTRGLMELVVLNIGYDWADLFTGFCDDGVNGIGYNFYDRAKSGFY